MIQKVLNRFVEHYKRAIELATARTAISGTPRPAETAKELPWALDHSNTSPYHRFVSPLAGGLKPAICG